MAREPDFYVQLVDEADTKVQVVGDQVLDISGASNGDFVAVNGEQLVPRPIEDADIPSTIARDSDVSSLLPWVVDVDVFPAAISNTNWDTITLATVYLYGAGKLSSGAQNDEIAWDIVLAAGTWTLELIHTKNTNLGIYTVSLDGTTIGTIDGYNGSAANNSRGSITGIAVAASGKTRLKLKMATKNASSSSYFGLIHALQMRRTA